MPPAVDLQELWRRVIEQTEWKENVANIDDVVETLSAFANDLANLGGGYVVCGAGANFTPTSTELSESSAPRSRSASTRRSRS